MVTNDVKYIGVNDHKIDLFEGHFHVENGMAYNSYVILDEKIAVFDTVDKNFTEEWMNNLQEVLDGRKPSYLIIQHMEPDHSANIMNFMNAYPETNIVATDKAFKMMGQFFGKSFDDNRIVTKDKSTLSLGKHELIFFTAPMVHWPEVMVTYDATDKILFSADGFGKFGALDVDEDWACEARRYYFGIVGKFGAQVQALLKKLNGAGAELKYICPLHGPVLKENLDYYLGLYQTWSTYGVETEGVVICYTSVYGNTKKAVELLAEELKKQGCPKVAVNDLARCDMAEAVEDAFRYGKIVLATTTYNGEIFPYMREFIQELLERGYKNRVVGLMENGSWAPMAAKTMKKMLEPCKNLDYTNTTVSILSAMTDANRAEVSKLAEELCSEAVPTAQAEDKESKPNHKYVCQICGYEYECEGELPADFTCPLCKQGADKFKLVE